MNEPLLIAVDGIDACGKTTLIQRITDPDVTAYKFPNLDAATGRYIKAGLDGRHPFHSPELLQSLMATNRYETAPEIRDLLAAGETVVLDRYFASGIAYGLADGLAERWLWDINASLPMPDLYVLIDVSPEASMARRPDGRDRLERDAERLHRVRKHYLDLWIKNPAVTSWRGQPMRWALIYGEQDPEDVYQVFRVVVQRIHDEVAGVRHAEIPLIPGKEGAGE